MNNWLDTIQSAAGKVIDTAATVYVAKNSPAAPTDTPKVAEPPAALPPTQPTTGVPPVTAAPSGVPQWVWIAGALVAVGGIVAVALKRRR